MLCPIKVNSNTIDLIMHTSCYCVLDLLCVKKQKLETNGRVSQTWFKGPLKIEEKIKCWKRHTWKKEEFFFYFFLKVRRKCYFCVSKKIDKKVGFFSSIKSLLFGLNFHTLLLKQTRKHTNTHTHTHTHTLTFSLNTSIYKFFLLLFTLFTMNQLYDIFHTETQKCKKFNNFLFWNCYFLRM